jgi:hypothetical protein
MKNLSLRLAVWVSLVGTLALGCQTTHTLVDSKGRRSPSGDVTPHPLEGPEKSLSPMTLEQENGMIRGLTQGILSKIKTIRDAHPKAHACVEAKLTVEPVLSSEHKEGIFDSGASYSALVRFSSGSSNPKADDRLPGIHGMAVKILLPQTLQDQVPDLAGEVYVLPKETYKTFDIITINGVEEFLVNDLASYPAFFKASEMVAIATQEAMAAKKTPDEIKQIIGQTYLQEYISKVPASLRPVIGGLLQKIGSVRTTNLLSETYNSWVPYAFGTKAVKYSFRPCSEIVEPANLEPSENYLGNQLRQELKNSANQGCFELVAHFHEDSYHSVENASLPWGDPKSRTYVPLGKLELSSSFTEPEFCEALSFNPAHALQSQRGIGAIQRARRVIYAEISDRRNKNLKP